MPNLAQAKKELNRYANEEKAEFLKRFFKTGKGDYAEGDRFLGIVVPTTRKVAKKFRDLPLDQVFKLLQSKYHEERLLALFILVDQFQLADEDKRKSIYTAYLELAPDYVNNWDLVDSSAEPIIGAYLEHKSRRILYKLAKSQNLWERRIAMLSTFHFIRNNDFKDTLDIALILINDKHDLIHKAAGWLLREVGKRSEKTLKKFLDQYRHKMPRTMLRYAIEKFPDHIRKQYLTQKNRKP